MLNEIIDVVKGIIEPESKDRKLVIKLANKYLARVSGFQDRLVLLAIVINLAFIAFTMFLGGCAGGMTLVVCAIMVLTNMFIGKLYLNGHETVKLLFTKYPELVLITKEEKSWSNFLLLVNVYKGIQVAWLLYSACAIYFMLGGCNSCPMDR